MQLMTSLLFVQPSGFKNIQVTRDLLWLLLTHVKGDAKRALTSILYGANYYAQVFEMLERRYGNKTKTTNA